MTVSPPATTLGVRNSSDFPPARGYDGKRAPPRQRRVDALELVGMERGSVPKQPRARFRHGLGPPKEGRVGPVLAVAHDIVLDLMLPQRALDLLAAALVLLHAVLKLVDLRLQVPDLVVQRVQLGVHRLALGGRVGRCCGCRRRAAAAAAATMRGRHKIVIANKHPRGRAKEHRTTNKGGGRSANQATHIVTRWDCEAGQRIVLRNISTHAHPTGSC